MSSDTDKHHQLLSSLKAAQGKGDGSFDEAVTRAFEHVFEHLERLSTNVSSGGTDGDERPLKTGESSTLR